MPKTSPQKSYKRALKSAFASSFSVSLPIFVILTIGYSVFVGANALARSPDSVRATRFEASFPADLRVKLSADLAFVKTIQLRGQSPLHAHVFGATNGDVYYRWLSQRISAFAYEPGHEDFFVAYNDPDHNGRIVISDYFTRGSLPQIARIMTIFHEARHSETEHGNWEHIYCPKPFNDASGNPVVSISTGHPLAGEPACDETAMGAYGISVVLMDNLSRFCTNCSEKLRLDAALYGRDQKTRIVQTSERKRLVSDSHSR